MGAAPVQTPARVRSMHPLPVGGMPPALLPNPPPSIPADEDCHLMQEAAMRYRWMSPLSVAALLALAGCGTVTPQPGGPEPDPDARAFSRAIVVDGNDLDSHTNNLLSVLRRRIAGMQVSYTGNCPDVVLRSRKSLFGDNSPIVYVDGARVSNTCVLEQLQPSDVSRIEVYVQGITPRTGYESHANGLILVFMRTGEIF